MRLLPLLLAVGTLAACASDDNDKSADLAATSDMAVGDLAGPTFTSHVVENVVTDGGDPPAIGGARVCWETDTAIPCTVTASDGSYTMPFPPLSETSELDVALVVTADGYIGSTLLLPEQLPLLASPAETLLDSEEQAATAFANVGFTFPLGNSALIAGCFNGGGVPGGTIASSSGKVVYLDIDGNLDATLPATTSNGCFLVGNATPGAFTLTYALAGNTCAKPPNLLDETWAQPTPNKLVGYVAAGTIVTEQNLYCQ